MVTAKSSGDQVTCRKAEEFLMFIFCKLCPDFDHFLREKVLFRIYLFKTSNENY